MRGMGENRIENGEANKIEEDENEREIKKKK